MSLFQIVVVTLLALAFVGNLTVVARGQVSRRVGLPWMLVWFAAALAVAWPDSTTRIAKMLGIDRGANLVLYCFVLVTMFGFYMTYVRLRRLDANLTLLVRRLAMQGALVPENHNPDNTAASPDGEPADAAPPDDR